jgi:hypothetical protein
MNVVPFPKAARAPTPEALASIAFTMGARVDLRIGSLAAGVVKPRGDAKDAFEYSNIARLLRCARMAWRERGAHCPIVLAIPAEVQSTLDAEFLDEAAAEAGCTRPTFGFELDERALVNTGGALAQDLRARGWDVSLRADPACPLPFGARARALYSELIVDVPENPSPYLAIDDDATPLGRRILAARGAGMIITASNVRTIAQAKSLALIGFDRGGGPFAEASLR